MKIEAKISGHEKVRTKDYLDVEDQDVEGADFSGLKLRGFSGIGSRFTRCAFEKVKIGNAAFGAGQEQSLYVECSFDGARIEAAAPGNARFERCSFRDVKLKNWFCWELELVDCVFSGRGDGLLFNGVPDEDQHKELGRPSNEYRGNDFSGMDLRDCAFRRGIDLRKQQLPSGSGYLTLVDARAAVVFARREVSGWDDDERRRHALQLLGIFMEDVANGQDQLFIRPDDFTRLYDRQLLEDLSALLAAGDEGG
jgi:hypothetical protein